MWKSFVLIILIYSIYSIMQRTASLSLLDKQLRSYHLQHNYAKRQSISTTHHSKGEIASFYRAMGQQFLHQRLRQHNEKPTRSQSQIRIKAALNNPLATALPTNIPQTAVSSVEESHSSTLSSKTPLFSKVEVTKHQHQFQLSKEVKDAVCEDIGNFQLERRKQQFSKKFPRASQHSQQSWERVSSEDLVKEFNRILVKYKSNGGTGDCDPVELENAFEEAMASANEQKFRILALFKKLYLESKANLNQQLLKYVLQFHTQQILNPKNRLRTAQSNKQGNLQIRQRAALKLRRSRERKE